MSHYLACAMLATLIACGPATPNQRTAPVEPEGSGTARAAAGMAGDSDEPSPRVEQQDSDEDGVFDSKDACPTESGKLASGKVSPNGCPDPDADRDEIADVKDSCKDKPETRNGYQDADGCPDEIPKELAKFTGAIKGIQFRTGGARIAPSSYASLNEAVKILKKYRDLRIEIQGHTDSAGDPAKNRKLSDDRAHAVLEYLAKKGIARHRLTAKGYGSDVPIAPNDTAAGRTKNRRVEFKILTAHTFGPIL